MLLHLLEFFKEQEIEYAEKLDVSTVSYVKIGGAAAYAAMPSSTEKLVKLVDFLIEAEIPYRLVGAMSNILPKDEDYRGVLIITTKCNGYILAENGINAECGVKLSRVIRDAARLGLCGAESLFGIPGTVGGMVYSNAGAYGVSVSDLLTRATVYSPGEKKIFVLDADDFKFSYRHSELMGTDNILLSADFAVHKDDAVKILERISAVGKKRRNTQPCDLPSLGSVFKRSGDVPISLLIDKLGLKGLSVGGAQISKKHAGFIVNTGGATEKNFLELVFLIKNRVYEEYGIMPVEEIERF